jgi:hypothetical protein
VGVGCAAVLVVLVVGARQHPAAAELIDRGFEPARALERLGPSEGAAAVADIGRSAGFESWLAYDTRLPYRHLVAVEDLEVLATSDPNAPVLVHDSCSDGEPGDLCRKAWAVVEPDDGTDGVAAWQVLTAGELLARISTPAPGPTGG